MALAYVQSSLVAMNSSIGERCFQILGVSVVREQSSSRPWGEGELTAYIFTRHDAPLIRQYLHNRRLGFRRLHVDAVASEGGIEVFLV